MRSVALLFELVSENESWFIWNSKQTNWHWYLGIDIYSVWDAIEKDLPELKKQLAETVRKSKQFPTRTKVISHNVYYNDMPVV